MNFVTRGTGPSAVDEWVPNLTEGFTVAAENVRTWILDDASDYWVEMNIEDR